MNDRITQIASRLKEDSRFRLSALDCASANFIKPDVSQDHLDQNHDGDFRKYLDFLKNKGFSTVQFQPRTKHGNINKVTGPAFNISLNSNGQSMEKQTPPANATPGASIESFGLGLPDLMELKAQPERVANQYLSEQLQGQKAQSEAKLQELTQQNKQLEIKLNKVKKKRDKLQQKVNIYEIKEQLEPQPNPINSLIEQALQPDGLIQQGLGMYLESKNSGLNAASSDPDADLSDSKRQLIAALRDAPEEIAEVIYNTTQKLAAGEPGFLDELKNLIQSYNLRKVENND